VLSLIINAASSADHDDAEVAPASTCRSPSGRIMTEIPRGKINGEQAGGLSLREAEHFRKCEM